MWWIREAQSCCRWRTGREVSVGKVGMVSVMLTEYNGKETQAYGFAGRELTGSSSTALRDVGLRHAYKADSAKEGRRDVGD